MISNDQTAATYFQQWHAPSHTSSRRAEAARRLGVTRERVRQLLNQGMLAGFRIEGRARARYVDLSGQWSENDSVLVSIQEAARRAEVSASTIRTWIETGLLEAFPLEGDRRVYVALD